MIVGIDVGGSTTDAVAIEEAITKAISREFKEGLKGMKNPYGRGNAVDTILNVLVSTPMGNQLMRKKFIDE